MQPDCRSRSACPRLTLVFALLLLLALTGTPATAGAPDVAAMIASQDVEGLRQLGPTILPEVLRLYAASDEAGRANVAWILYHLGFESEEAMRLLMADVHTEHESLRIWSQYALGRVSSSDEVVNVLFDNMLRTDAKWLFRDKAACGLAYDQIHLTEQQKVRLFGRLIEVLDADDAGTRSLAIQVLAVYTGQTKGYDAGASVEARRPSIEHWRKWLAEYRSQL